MKKKIILVLLCGALGLTSVGCGHSGAGDEGNQKQAETADTANGKQEETGKSGSSAEQKNGTDAIENQSSSQEGTSGENNSTLKNTSGKQGSSQEGTADKKDSSDETDSGNTTGQQSDTSEKITQKKVYLKSSMKYAGYSKIHSDAAVLYQYHGPLEKNYTVCVNAGHGTSGGSSVMTQCHPDGSPKVTGGSTSAGSTKAVAVSGGMTFADGTPEAAVNLKEAKKLKKLLLKNGYNVLMIRQSEDVQLDNVARAVLANEYADCHIAIHWDSAAFDNGAFYCSVPDSSSYRSMEPVASVWKKDNALGKCLISGLSENGRKIRGSGSMPVDLTQTSYSSVPSTDIELGDKASDHSEHALEQITQGLLDGVNKFYKQQ